MSRRLRVRSVMIKKGIFSAIKAVRKTVLIPVKLYQRFISPLKGTSSCRFTPTCSQYAIDAVMEWGIVIGAVLALWRLIRCNPFSKGGRDEVPKCPFRINREAPTDKDE